MFAGKFIQSLILITLVALGGLSVFAQGKFGTSVIKTDGGYLIVQNREKTSFSLEFKGESLKPLKSDHPTFVLDGKLIQVVTVSYKNYWNPAEKSAAEPGIDQLLESHKIWESDYLGEALNAKLSVTSELFEIDRRRKVMFWSFPMPKNLESTYSHQLFLTTLIDKDVVGINASPTRPEEQKAYREFIVASMNTLKTSDKPFNIKELREFLKEGDSAE